MSKIKQQSGLDNIHPYVPGTPIEEVQRRYGILDVIKMASNENPFGTSPLAAQAIYEKVTQLNSYPDGVSYYLRQAIADFHQVDLDQVFTDNGADGVIQSLCLAYLDNDDEVIVGQSSFPVYDVDIQVMRARLIKTPRRNYGLDLEAMAAAITERTKMIFVCNPNNPTGTIVRAPEVETFLERVPEHVLVVFDEAYFEFVDDPQFPDTIRYIHRRIPNIMLLRTLSKTYGLAGLRIGYGLGPPEVLAPLFVVKGSFSVNLLAQAGGIAALEDQEFLHQTVHQTRINRAALTAAFEEMELQVVPSQTNFILVWVGKNATEVYTELMKQGVIVRPCVQYELPEFLRITVGTTDHNARLIASMKRVLGR